jgi:hypothetical protein
MLNTPILFLVFNRPDTTKQVFAKIREVKPKQLFIAADGAREHKEGEQAKVDEVRKFILENIDWDCEVKTLFRDKNLGCGKAVSEAITWFFEQVEQGIILEDDCLPETSFFYFCEQLLERYKEDDKVMHIGGTSFIKYKNHQDLSSYFFSDYSRIWGWATWRRSWSKYNFSIEWNDNKLTKILKKKKFTCEEVKYWRKVFSNYHRIDTWDYQWMLSIWYNDGISIAPYKNLVQNIGFGGDSTHTKQVGMERLSIESSSLDDLIHPSHVIIDRVSDIITFRFCFPPPISLHDKLRMKLFRIIKYFQSKVLFLVSNSK